MQTTDKWNYYLDDDDCTCMDFFDSKNENEAKLISMRYFNLARLMPTSG